MLEPALHLEHLALCACMRARSMESRQSRNRAHLSVTRVVTGNGHSPAAVAYMVRSTLYLCSAALLCNSRHQTLGLGTGQHSSRPP